jgi:hypothetical protein
MIAVDLNGEKPARGWAVESGCRSEGGSGWGSGWGTGWAHSLDSLDMSITIHWVIMHGRGPARLRLGLPLGLGLLLRLPLGLGLTSAM